jgi:biopolymer transport protein ExbD
LNKGGLLIRLIDVAMIILFGFIAISDIKVRAQIKLPSEKTEQEEQQDYQEPALLFVRIGLDNQVELTDEAAFSETVLINRLESRLLEKRREFSARDIDMVVLIEPHEDSIMQHTIDVLDICQRHDIAKNINYKSMQF